MIFNPVKNDLILKRVTTIKCGLKSILKFHFRAPISKSNEALNSVWNIP